MPRDLMTRCQHRKQYKKPDGEYRWLWKEETVAELVGVQPKDLRCMHCRGAVRVYKQKAPGGEEYIEHRSKVDSAGCQGGVLFDGTQRMSLTPVR